jgi:hypothetical protein
LARAPPPGVWRASAPARCRISMLSSGVSASGPASATKASSAPAGRSARSAVALGGYRLLRVHVESLEPGGGNRREGVELGTECAQWADQLGADDGAAEAGGFHHRPGPAAHELGDLGEGRQPQDPADGGDLVRHRVGPLAPGVEDLCGALDREEQRSRIQLGHRIQHHLDRGHDADAAAPASDGPEQVRLVVGVGSNKPGGRRPAGQQPRLDPATVADDQGGGRRARPPRRLFRCADGPPRPWRGRRRGRAARRRCGRGCGRRHCS